MEVWKDVKDFEQLYAVSNQGRIQSKLKQKIMSPCKHSKGYLKIALQRNKKRLSKYVHRLVAEHFIRNPKIGEQVNHKDGDKTNNHVENLEWVTCSQNHKHSYRTGLRCKKGANNNLAKLSQNEILEIRRLRKEEKKKYKDIAELFNVSKGHIGTICRNKTWTHI